MLSVRTTIQENDNDDDDDELMMMMTMMMMMMIMQLAVTSLWAKHWSIPFLYTTLFAFREQQNIQT